MAARVLSAGTCAFYVELAENGVIHRLPWRAPRSAVGEEINGRSVTLHTSADSGDA